MKKILGLLLCVIIIGGIVTYTYSSPKRADVKYTVEKYFTSGIFNNYKMCSISTLDLSFSNGTIAVVKIEGLENKAPHKKTAYNVFLEKSNKGLWQVKKIYSSNPTLKVQQ